MAKADSLDWNKNQGRLWGLTARMQRTSVPAGATGLGFAPWWHLLACCCTSRHEKFTQRSNNNQESQLIDHATFRNRLRGPGDATGDFCCPFGSPPRWSVRRLSLLPVHPLRLTLSPSFDPSPPRVNTATIQPAMPKRACLCVPALPRPGSHPRPD